MALNRKILKKKIDILENTPERYFKKIESVNKELYKEAINLISEFNVVNGRLKLDTANIEVVSRINDILRSTLNKGEYFEAVKSFIMDFDESISISDEYFSKEIEGYKRSEAADTIYKIQRTKMIELFISNSSIDSNFLQPIRTLLLDAISQEMGLKELTQSIRDNILGTDKYDGKLMRYSKQIAIDTLNVSDRVYNSTVSNELGLEFFTYVGGKVDSTRCFCIQRNGKTFHKKEIEDWAKGNVDSGFENDSKYKSCGKEWQGKYRDTNATNIFNVLGGYNCRHSLAPRSLISVPRDVIIRNINKKYFNPTEKQKKLLSL